MSYQQNQEMDNWNDHWDKYSNSASDNPAQKYRHQLMINIIKSKYSKNDTFNILDIGSGQGDFLLRLAKEFPKSHLVGFELSETGVMESKIKVPNATFLQVDIIHTNQNLDNFINWASVICCSEVLEHIDDPKQFLELIFPFLNLEGIIIITVPGGPMSSFDRHIGHRKHFSADDLKLLLFKAGYFSPKVYKTGFPFFNLYRLVTIIRGDRLITDVEKSYKGFTKTLSIIVMNTFNFFFKLNLSNSPFGWQIIGSARKV